MLFDPLETVRTEGMKKKKIKEEEEGNTGVRINFVSDTERESSRTLTLNVTTERNCISAIERERGCYRFVRGRETSNVRCEL